MNLTVLPEVIEDIVNEYVSQLEHSEKYNECLDDINNIEYTLSKFDNGTIACVRYISDGDVTCYNFKKDNDLNTYLEFSIFYGCCHAIISSIFSKKGFW